MEKLALHILDPGTRRPQPALPVLLWLGLALEKARAMLHQGGAGATWARRGTAEEGQRITNHEAQKNSGFTAAQSHSVAGRMTLAGLEPAIFGSEDQRLIH